jgi:hypothetical protein
MSLTVVTGTTGVGSATVIAIGATTIKITRIAIEPARDLQAGVAAGIAESPADTAGTTAHSRLQSGTMAATRTNRGAGDTATGMPTTWTRLFARKTESRLTSAPFRPTTRRDPATTAAVAGIVMGRSGAVETRTMTVSVNAIGTGSTAHIAIATTTVATRKKRGIATVIGMAIRTKIETGKNGGATATETVIGSGIGNTATAAASAPRLSRQPRKPSTRQAGRAGGRRTAVAAAAVIEDSRSRAAATPPRKRSAADRPW